MSLADEHVRVCARLTEIDEQLARGAADEKRLKLERKRMVAERDEIDAFLAVQGKAG